MSVYLMSLVFKSGLEKGAKAIALSLADHGHDDGSNIFPSIEYTAWKTGYSERGVHYAIKNLVDAGILVEIGKLDSGVKKYWMDVTKLPVRPPFKSKRKGWKSMSAKIADLQSEQSGVQETTTETATVADKPLVNHQESLDSPLNPPSPKTKSITQQAKEIYLQLLPKYLELFHKKDPKRFPEHKPGNTTIISNIVSLLKSKHVGDYGIFADNYINAIEHAAGWKFLYETNFFNLVWFTKKKRGEPYGWEKCMERGKSLDKQSEDVDIRRMI